MFKDEKELPNHSHITSVSFEGTGALGGQKISFSPALNTLIGIRGSGKSSILEAIRYALDIPLQENTSDKSYKENLVEYLLGSGGKIIIHAIDKRGCHYEIHRIKGEKLSNIKINGVLRNGISISDTILYKPIYFGQKDLSNSGESFEIDLIEKLLSNELQEIRKKIESQCLSVRETLHSFKRLENLNERKQETIQKKKDIEYKLDFYKQHDLEKTLQKQIEFEKDERQYEQLIQHINNYISELKQFIETYKNSPFLKFDYQSVYNQSFFDNVKADINKLIADLHSLNQIKTHGVETQGILKAKKDVFLSLKDAVKEEFAAIERQTAEKFKAANLTMITTEEFLSLHKELQKMQQTLDLIDQQEQQQQSKDILLTNELVKLNDLWLQEYRLIENNLAKLNLHDSPLKIKSEFKGNKNAMRTFLKDILYGSKIRENYIEKIVNEYSDFIQIYRNLNEAKALMGNSANTFEQKFLENLESLLTYQVPNQFTLEYKGKELKQHSLGQRASALILFILNQKEHDVIIIDQPEDDLDNQTIYEDVVKLILELKSNIQFIFATHNANIPVLGDAEQIIACSYSDKKIDCETGSIDEEKIREKIVKIMEGGKEAFNKRQEIYQTWKL